MLLIGFGGISVEVEEEITLPKTIRIEPYQKTLPINFVVIHTTMAYNAYWADRPSTNFGPSSLPTIY